MPVKSVLNFPLGPAPRFRRILVPLDFSGASRQALPVAIALAAKLDARIVLVHVVTPIPPPAMPPALGIAPPTPIRGLRKQAAADLHERGQTLIPRELYDRSIVTMGHAASEIIAIAQRVEADLIVLTTHGRSGIKRFLMGSTAEHVVRHARCPVMTVRRAAAAKLPSRKRASRDGAESLLPRRAQAFV